MEKKKSHFLFYLFVFLILLFLVLQVVSVYSAGDTIFDIVEKYEVLIQKSPVAISWNRSYSIKAALFFTAFYFIYVIYDLTNNKNFMPGKEYGDAHWADIRDINKRFQDKVKNFNRIYSQHLRISMSSKLTKLNNNVLVIGGSGSGKSLFVLMANIYQAIKYGIYPGNFIFTDPKGELLQRNGKFLKKRGYRIKVLNLTTEGMSESDGYNPFDYIRRESDVDKLITNLIANTTDRTTTKQDGFWEKAESMFLQALFLFVWMDGERYGYKKNLNSVIDLLSLAEIPSEIDRQKKKKSELDKIFDQLVVDTKGRRKGGTRHPAYIKYRKTMGGAADTVRSILISANARMAIFENEEVRRLLEKDEMDLTSIGTGIVDGEKDVRTALFCVIPDADTTYNCIAGMLYTQLFQELYQVADRPMNRGKLPVPVTFWLDEFPNIALPDNFTKLLATMRSRLISSVIFIQNLAQIKKLYEKDWEVITGNCDVLVYLGGNEQSTHKYISDNLGKTTIWKRSRSRNFGKNGSSSKNEDVIGRELLTPNEVRELPNEKCIIFVRGQSPIIDDKFHTLECEEFQEAESLGIYVHSVEKKGADAVSIISKEEYIKAKKQGKAIEVNISEEDVKKALYGRNLSDKEVEELLAAKKERTDVPAPDDAEIVIDISNLTLEQILFIPEVNLSDEEMDEVIAGIEHGLPEEMIKSYILINDVNKMRAKRRLLEAMLRRKER